MLPSVVPSLARLSSESVSWCLETSLFFKTPFPRWISIPNFFFFLYIFYILSYLLSKTMGCFSGCLMSSASIQKLFCGIYSAFKCSFNEFVGEKVFSPSYSSAVLGPPQSIIINPEKEKKEILSFATMWLDPEDVILSEINQTEKQIHHDFTYV